MVAITFRETVTFAFLILSVYLLAYSISHSCLDNKSFWWLGSATYAALCPTVSAMATLGNRSGSLQDGAIVPSDLFTSYKGTPLLVHPMFATLGNRSGSLQDGTIVLSGLLTSQKGTPLLVHPNIGSPRNAATLGEVSSAFSATHFSPP